MVVGRSADQFINGGVTVHVVSGTDMTLNNDLKVLAGEIDGADEIFSEMVAVGTTGSGIEMGLDSARAALSEPMLSEANAGFLREDANLSIIFVSDENDYSRDPVNDYLMHFRDLKGDAAHRDNGMVNISAVVGNQEPAYEGQPSCESDDGVADFGTRYMDLATRTDGAVESICDDDFSPIASELGLTVSGLEVEFILSGLPDESSMKVKICGDAEETSLIGELEKMWTIATWLPTMPFDLNWTKYHPANLMCWWNIGFWLKVRKSRAILAR